MLIVVRMPTGSTKTPVSRLLATFALVAAVLASAVGPHGGLAVAMAKACGVACPCDEGVPGTHEDDDADCDDEGAGPCDQECPDSCPDCSCSPGLVAAVVPSILPGVPGCSTPCMIPSPPQALSSPELVGVFRPPRSAA